MTKADELRKIADTVTWNEKMYLWCIDVIDKYVMTLAKKGEYEAVIRFSTTTLPHECHQSVLQQLKDDGYKILYYLSDPNEFYAKISWRQFSGNNYE